MRRTLQDGWWAMAPRAMIDTPALIGSNEGWSWEPPSGKILNNNNNTAVFTPALSPSELRPRAAAAGDGGGRRYSLHGPEAVAPAERVVAVLEAVRLAAVMLAYSCSRDYPWGLQL